MAANPKPRSKKILVPLALILVLAVFLAVPSTRNSMLGFFNLTKEQAEEGVYYTCPMHPDIRLPQAGECPICGMTLVKKTVGSEEQSGRINVTTRQVQLTGVTVEKLRSRELIKEIDTYGQIDYDETRLSVVAAWVGGRIDKLYVNFTGVTVNKGHALVYLYSPDLISTEKEYLLARANLFKVQKSNMKEAIANAQALVNSSRQRLLWWGLSESQIERIGQSGDVEDHITIYAPIGGTVIDKHAYEGMYVKEGEELFHIADLSRVWLYADIYEDEIPFLFQKREGDYYECIMHPEERSDKPGTCPECGMELTRTNPSLKVEIATRAFPGEVFTGTISFTDPYLNPETRTVRVRVNIDNPDLKLKPGMFARARMLIPVGKTLAVPENAVLFSGKRRIVLVEEEKGRFRPQPVKLGRLWLNDRNREEEELTKLVFKREALRYHEVLAGLEEGEKVVTSGNFLLGSESQLQGALTKMLEITDEEEASSGQTEEEVSYEFSKEQSISDILEAYYGIQKLLAEDKTDGVDKLAEAILESAKSKSIKDAAEPLHHASQKNDIKATRDDFETLSDVLIAYIEKYKSSVSRLPARFYCPMRDAEWLQDAQQTKANPYYGTAMLKCGEVVSWDEE
jgi:Cu(I)/Ag(I) efflux system membrane fusion protein